MAITLTTPKRAPVSTTDHVTRERLTDLRNQDLATALGEHSPDMRE